MAQTFVNQAIPGIPADTPPALRQFLEAVKRTIEVREGKAGALQKALTLDDLHKAGVVDLVINGVRVSSDGTAASGFISAGFNNRAVPPAVAGLSAAGGLGSIILTWDDIDDSAVSHVQIWRANTDDFSAAVIIGTSTAPLYADAVGSGAVKYYWVKAVSPGGIAGPLNDVSGTRGETSYDPSYINDILRIKWVASKLANTNDYVIPTPAEDTGLWYKATTFGLTGLIEPDWPIIVGGTVVDNQVTWEAVAASEQQATFLVGDVNGVPSVIINGDLYADGTIVARMIKAGEISADKMSVTELAAITANLGAITAGSLDINGKFIVSPAGLVTIKSATTGARMEIANNVLKVYDTTGTLRVKIGDLSA